jgi:diguanylate cyclase (GGDEF)-like protein
MAIAWGAGAAAISLPLRRAHGRLRLKWQLFRASILLYALMMLHAALVTYGVVPAGLDFHSSAIGFCAMALQLVAITFNYEASLKYRTWVIDAIFAGCLCVLVFVGLHQPDVDVTHPAYAAFNFVLCMRAVIGVVATIAWYASVSSEERYFNWVVCIYAWTDAGACLLANQVGHLLPSWDLLDVALDAPPLVIVYLCATHAAARYRSHAHALTPFLRYAMSLVAMLVLCGLSANLLLHNSALGLAGLAVAVLGYAYRSIVRQSRYAAVNAHLHAQNAKLLELADTDALTGLRNRRAFERELKARLDASQVQPFALMMIDVDGFKHVNDCFGHAVGDRILKGVAQCLAQSTALPGALAARVGGDEFAIVVNTASLGKATDLAEQIRADVARLRVAAMGKNLVSLSIGVAIVDHAMALPTAMRRADFALYRAKRSGRNRVVSNAEAVLPAPSKKALLS